MLKIGYRHVKSVWPILEVKLRAKPAEALEGVGILFKSDRFWTRKNIQNAHPKVMRHMTFLVRSGGHCVIVLVRDVSSCMMVVVSDDSGDVLKHATFGGDGRCASAPAQLPTMTTTLYL